VTNNRNGESLKGTIGKCFSLSSNRLLLLIFFST
jgi:hypothetical protein